MKKHVVKLSQNQREELECMLQSGSKINLSVLIHAYVLLMADCGELGPAWPVLKICGAVHISAPTVQHIKQNFIDGGLQHAVYDAKRTYERKIDSEAIDHLTMIMGRQSPVGHRRWTQRCSK